MNKIVLITTKEDKQVYWKDTIESISNISGTFNDAVAIAINQCLQLTSQLPIA